MRGTLSTVALVVGVLLLFAGYAAYDGRGAEIERLNERIDELERDADFASEEETLLLDQLDTCRGAIRDAQQFARSAVRSHLQLYDTAVDWAFEAYTQGAVGTSTEDMNLGLGRVMAETEERYRSLQAADIAQYEYLGWAGGLMSARPNAARVCLGIQDE
jgi:hypothetical protein